MKIGIQYLLIYLVVILSTTPFFSQECDLPKLLNRLSDEVRPSGKFDIRIQLGKCYLNNNPDSSYTFFKEAIEIP